MSIATTPSQIKKEYSGVPTCGTVIVIDTRSDHLEFVVAMGQTRLIDLLKKLVVAHKAWSPVILRTIVRATPTCPLPKHPIRELCRIVKFTPLNDQIEWTSDNWETKECCHYIKASKIWVTKKPQVCIPQVVFND